MSSQPYFITIIADYGTGDLAFQEVKQRLRLIPQVAAAQVDQLSVPAFNTIATGFALGQLANKAGELGPRMIYYVNTAPRKDDLQSREKNAGERFVYARMHNGAQILAVNSGYSLSFVKANAEKLCVLKVSDRGSQFRSRDVFPEALKHLMAGNQDVFGEDVDVPDMPECVVGFIDGYGNVKTTIRKSSIGYKKGRQLQITINGETHTVIAGQGIFDIPDGAYVLAPGSSGWQTSQYGEDDHFMEIVRRGGSAARSFGYPAPGSAITIEEIA